MNPQNVNIILMVLIITSYTIGFYEIPVDIRAIFWYFFSVFHEPIGEWNTEKNTKKLREYHRYFLKTHGITVLSYNYLIFTHHNALYRQLTGVRRDFFKCMNELCSSSMMNANVNNSERHNSERQQ